MVQYLTVSQQLSHIKGLPAASVKKMLRARGFRYPVVAVARLAGVTPGLVSRVIRKLAVSERVWQVIADMIAGKVSHVA